MNVAYYPGCSGKGTSAEYEQSTQAVFSALGIGLKELPDWSCCGSTPAHATDGLLSAALSARNLCIAKTTMEKNGASRFVTPCPSCLSNLKTARAHMAEPDFRAKVNKLLDEPSPNIDDKGQDPLPDAISTLQLLLEDFGLENIAKMVKKPLKGLKIAPYYGCLLTRPANIMKFGSPENPTALDELLKTLGAEVVDFPCKTECCGASMGVPRRDITARLSGHILETATRFGANMVAVACPLCQMNLDLRQKQAKSASHGSFNLPVLYFTQLMGIALGLPEANLGLDKLSVDPRPVLAQIGKEVSA